MSLTSCRYPKEPLRNPLPTLVGCFEQGSHRFSYEFNFDMNFGLHTLDAFLVRQQSK